MADESTDTEDKEEKKLYDLSKTADQIAIFRDKLSEDEVKDLISGHLEKMQNDSGLSDYELLFLYDDSELISPFHSNRIYQAAKDINKKKNILLLVESRGGQVEPAYLISKTCKRLSKSKFNVVIPRKAKSAATLISLGANELHMGLLSELGPIDPQFDGFPALGLSNAMEKIAAMSEKYPNASDMFAKYLTDNINIQHLGLFERINESATQYASRLLEGKDFPDGWNALSLADHFTNHYKDHGFLIDADEAKTLLGAKVVKEETKEYNLGNDIYEFFEFNKWLFKIFMKEKMRYVGGIRNGLDLSKIDD